MCVSACPQGFFGLDCQEKCLCLNGGSCDHVSGVCSCPAGWIGPFCNLSEWQVHHRKFDRCWRRFSGIRGSDGSYQLKHREHLCNADSEWNKNTLGFKVIWENPAQSHMRKHWLDVPCGMACITYQTVEFPLLISRVHEEVKILFVPLLAACPTGSYGEGCNQTCSCRNDGICHPASGRCVCTPGWTGPNCTEGEWTQPRAKRSSKWQVNKGSHGGFVCVVFLPECPAGFYGADCRQRCLCQNGATCDKTNGKCTCGSGWMGTACELGKTLEMLMLMSKRFCMCYRTTTIRWITERKILIYYNFVLLAVIYNNIHKSGNTDVATATSATVINEMTGCKQANRFITFLKL